MWITDAAVLTGRRLLSVVLHCLWIGDTLHLCCPEIKPQERQAREEASVRVVVNGGGGGGGGGDKIVGVFGGPRKRDGEKEVRGECKDVHHLSQLRKRIEIVAPLQKGWLVILIGRSLSE